MPLLKVEIEKGNNKEFLISLIDLIMNCVQEALQLLPDDRNIRLTEFEKGFFQMKQPYRFIIEISMFSGRSAEIKKKMYQLIVSTLPSLRGNVFRA